MVVICILLGTSYAYWGQITVVDATIKSGHINATTSMPSTFTAQSKEAYIMCSNIRCNSGGKHHQNSKITFKLEDDSIPISVRSIKVTGFRYSSEMYQIVPTEVCVGRKWVWDGWFTGHYEDVYATKNILSKAEPFTKTVEFTETQLATLNKEGKISANISKNIIEIDLNDEAVRKAMKCQWRAGGNEFSIDKKNGWGDWYTQNITRPAHADIDTSKTGFIDVKIVYSQFNTPVSGGWQKELIIKDIPVYWYRFNPDRNNNFTYPQIVNGNNVGMSIEPGNEKTFDY